MTLRESFNNTIRSDRPESPTDMMFIFLCFILGMLWIYSQLMKTEITGLVIMIAFISTLKVIKIGGDYQKKRKAGVSETIKEDTEKTEGTKTE